MSQSLSQMYTHIVFSTKHREPFLIDKDFSNAVHAYLVGLCRNLNSPSLIIGGARDHVHILCNLSRDLKICEFLKVLKLESSKWIKRTYPTFRMFYWQSGYGTFSVSPSHLAALRKYIENQELHHQSESFQDEFRRLLIKYGVSYDERYVWE